MSSLSAVVIAFNEEKRIADCLNSLKAVADELILVDSGSGDQTREIAKNLGAIVIHHPFEGHVQQKNFAAEQATHDLVLSLDADEVLSEELQFSILKAKEKGFECKGYSFNRRNNYAGKWLLYGGWYPDRKIRLWDRRFGRWGGMNPHDEVQMQVGQKVEHLKGDILHYTYDSIQDHIDQMERFATISARAYFERGKRTNALEALLNPAFSFLRDYIFLAGILDGAAGWNAVRIKAGYQYKKYKRLLALQQGNKLS